MTPARIVFAVCIVAGLALGAWLIPDYYRYRDFITGPSTTLYVSDWRQQPFAALRLLGLDATTRVVAVPATGETITHRSIRLSDGKTIDSISTVQPNAASPPAASESDSQAPRRPPSGA